jgi:thiamine biosynthesis protein ThiI
MQVIVRYGELFLKSEPVKTKFLNRLCTNIRDQFSKAGEPVIIKKIQGRLLLDLNNHKTLQKVFGVVSYSPVIISEKDMNVIKEHISKIPISDKASFAVRAIREDKNFPLTSKEIQEQIGDAIRSDRLTVDLVNPDKVVYIEIRDKAYIYTDIYQGPGGLPYGVSGPMLSVLKTENDVLATYLMMRRGVKPLITQGKKFLTILNNWAPVQLTLVDKKKASTKAKGVISGKISKELKQELKTGKLKTNKDGLPVYHPLAGYSAAELRELKKVVFD